MTNDFANALKSAILRQDEGELIALKQAFDRSSAPLDLFESLDFDEQERELLAQNHAWMGRVYDLLADSYENSMEPFAEPADEGHLDEIGQSFARLLLAG